MHPWSWGKVRVRVRFWVGDGDGYWVRALVVHPWISVDEWRRNVLGECNVLGEGDGVGNLCSEGVGAEDAMAPIITK